MINLSPILNAPVKERPILYTALAESILRNASQQQVNEDLVQLISHFLAEQNIITTRALLSDLFLILKKQKNPHLVPVWEFALAQTTTKTAFEQQETEIREVLAEFYQEEERWIEAARMLQGIPMDSGFLSFITPGHRQVPDDYKCRTFIQMTALFLEEDDSTSAESYLNRAGLLIQTCSLDKELVFRYKSCQAR